MKLSLLQIILVASTLILLYMIIDARRRRKLRIFHALVFIAWLTIILVTSFNQNLLAQLWTFVGVEKGADFIVYISIIFLGFVFFSLLQNVLKQQQEITRLCTAQALREYKNFKKWEYIVWNNSKSKYLFLIRAYNEWSVIGWVIEEIIEDGFTNIVIVNDGSQDNTEEVIHTLIEKHNNTVNIIWLHHPINRGPWAANKTLFAFASVYATKMWCEWCVTYDADGQMSIKDMDTFVSYADHKKYDIVIGSRFVKGASTENMPWLRKFILQGARIVTYIFNGLRITDVPTGYRMYHVSILNKICITSDWFSYQNNIIESIRIHNMRFIEIPVHIKYTAYSLQKWQSNMSALKIVIRLIYSSLFHK